MNKKRKAIFLDRDGVINHDRGYVNKIEDFRFVADIFETLRIFQKEGFLLFIVTNQSGIGRGYYTKEDFDILTKWMLKKLKKEKVHIQKVYFCPHSPEEKCICRKPNPGMFDKAFKEYEIDKENSWMIGDKHSDIEAAVNAGINNTILIADCWVRDEKAKYIVNNIFDTIRLIK